MHNDTTDKQGGTTDEYYHLSEGQHTSLTSSGDSTQHYHESDREAGVGAAKAIAGTVNKGNWIVQPHDVTRILVGEIFECIDLFVAGVLAIDGKLTVTG